MTLSGLLSQSTKRCIHCHANMPTTRPRSSPRLKKPTPKAAALNTPPKAKAPSPTATPSKRQPNSHAASATPNKKPRRGLQHFQLKRKSDKKKPRVARELLEPELEPEQLGVGGLWRHVQATCQREGNISMSCGQWHTKRGVARVTHACRTYRTGCSSSARRGARGHHS